MKNVESSTVPVDQKQIEEVAAMTPFPADQLLGQRFARGNMLGGAAPVQEADGDAPWVSQK
ncbi:MAG: hypothetical protein RL097_690 [Candidatus Parcubacteria bacterium]|jgi:hypothetical protein